MTTLLIDNLVSLGVSYAQKSGTGASPDDFARKAAHLVVRTTAQDGGAESPDSVAFLASINALSAMLASAHLSARLADKGVGVNTASKQYETELSKKTLSTKSQPDTPADETSTTTYEISLNATQLQKLIDEAHAGYDDIQKQKTNTGEAAWNDKACMRYLHAYACTRAAYLHAIAVSARYTDPKTKQLAFEKTLKTRLYEDFDCKPVSPDFFIQCMCSDWMGTAGLILLVAGILALSLLLTTFINPAAGAALASMGLTSPVLIPTAISACVLSATIFSSRFFIQKNEREKIKLSEDAIENANNIAPQMVM